MYREGAGRAAGGDGRAADVERVVLEPRPQPFGGMRWHLRCPGCDRRARLLYLPPGATRFRCRRCRGLAYATQRLPAASRWRYRAAKIVARLGEDTPDGHVVKPLRMRWRTFDRLTEEATLLEHAALVYSLRCVLGCIERAG